MRTFFIERSFVAVQKSTLAVLLILSSLSVTSCNKPYSANSNANQNGMVKPSQLYFPHAVEFKLKNHGDGYSKDKAQCQSCHGADLKGGSSKISCNQCHTLFPHPEHWREGEQHGKTFKGLDSASRIENCLICHAKADSKDS